MMYLGRVVELGDWKPVLTRHPYTAALAAAVPAPNPVGPADPGHRVGEVPDPAPAGRLPVPPACPLAEDVCRRTDPALLPTGRPTTRVACHVAARWHAVVDAA